MQSVIDFCLMFAEMLGSIFAVLFLTGLVVLFVIACLGGLAYLICNFTGKYRLCLSKDEVIMVFDSLSCYYRHAKNDFGVPYRDETMRSCDFLISKIHNQTDL